MPKPPPFKRTSITLSSDIPRSWKYIQVSDVCISDTVPDIGLVSEIVNLIDKVTGDSYIRLRGVGGNSQVYHNKVVVNAFVRDSSG